MDVGQAKNGNLEDRGAGAGAQRICATDQRSSVVPTFRGTCA